MPIATLTNLSLAFGTDQILDRIELSIENGERIAFTGRNGAGKSTLLGIISGAVNPNELTSRFLILYQTCLMSWASNWPNIIT